MFNKFIKTITILLLSVQISVTSLVGECNVCFAQSKIACRNETHFSTCFEGLPTTTITKCPGTRVCTDDVLICRSTEEGFTPSCYHDYCGDCSVSNGIFTCLDETTYGYCFGNITPLPNTLRSCPQGFVCNYNSQEVCVPDDTNQPSCKSKTTTTDPSTTYTTDISTISTESTSNSTTTEMTTETTTTTSTTTEEETESTTDSTTRTTTTQMLTTETSTQTPTTETTTTTEVQATETSTTTEIPTTQTTMTTETTSTEKPTPTTTEISTTETSTTAEIPTTETTTQTKTTTAAPRDPRTICGEIDQQGYFKSDDPTCREYVYCYILSGQYLGWFYYCDGYFNAETGKCQKERPLDCVAYEY